MLLFAYVWVGWLCWPAQEVWYLIAFALAAFLLFVAVTLGVAHFHPNQIVADRATRILETLLDFAKDLVASIVRRPERRP